MKNLFRAAFLLSLLTVLSVIAGISVSQQYLAGISWSYERAEGEPSAGQPELAQTSQPYSKLGQGGIELAEDSDHVGEGGPWLMTRDNATGLVWEAKDTSEGLRYSGNTYSWFNPDPETNGGHEGTPDGGRCTGSSCDINAFIRTLNRVNYGGFADWRLPSLRELSTLLVDREDGERAIDRYWFRRSAALTFYWSATSYDGNSYAAWRVGSGGVVSGDFKSHSYHIIAVRSGNLDILSPAPESVWTVDSAMEIRWETRDIPGDVKILLSRQDGRPGTFEVIAEGIANDGSYEWKVTDPGSARCVMKIEPRTEPVRAGINAGPFIIPYTLNYRAGMNGRIQGELSQNVEEGKHGSAVTAIPDEAYRFLEWTDGSRENPRRDMYVDRNLSVSAVFVSDPS